MSTTERTTRAPESATPKLAPAPRRQREKVEHFHWIVEGRIAAEMGVDVRHLCGTWGEPPSIEGASDPNSVTVFGDPETGDVIVEVETRDCRNCVRVLAAASRRQLRAQA